MKKYWLLYQENIPVTDIVFILYNILCIYFFTINGIFVVIKHPSNVLLIFVVNVFIIFFSPF